MFEKILLLVDERPETLVAAARALKLARLCDARVFAVSVLPEATPASGTDPKPDRALTGQATRSRRRRAASSEPEEAAWARLYEIEDDAFEENVRISLLLETGSRDEKLLALIDSYQLDALIIGTRSLAGWEKLVERCPVAVILLR
jgi:nucleotide-binding universal stress UspA family protein